MAAKSTNILFVDDRPETIQPLAIAIRGLSRPGERAIARVEHPRDIVANDLERANLVVVDFRIDEWDEREQLPLSLQPKNGIGLVGILRSHANEHSPTAFAIHTAHPAELSGDVPVNHREHSLARTFNLQWFFQKQAGIDVRARRMLELAEASAVLPTFSYDDSRSQIQAKLGKLLGLQRPKPKWFDRAWREIESCRPPVREISKWSHSLAILDWLLQRVLPYPCFLWTDCHMAARCGLTLNSFQHLLAGSKAFRAFFEPCTYRGICSDFLGRRWWRAGIEDLLWQHGNGQSLTRAELFALLNGLSRNRAERQDIANPVVVVDEDFVPVGVEDVSKAVRIGPDDWPPYAAEAWVSIDSVKRSEVLRALVVDNDRALLPMESS